MKKLYFLLLFVCAQTYAQTITVDDAAYTAIQKVNLLLGNSCVEVSNVNQSSEQAVAYFNQNGSTFPISEGIVIRNGNASFTQGTYTGTNLSSPTGLNTDPYLQALSNSSSGQTTPIQDVAFLEFDFIPTSNSFSFEFLFASNEYGEFQCISNDLFAFALTDLTTSTTTNLAVIPGTTNPVSVKSIRNAAYFAGCLSSNPSLFGVYNVTNPGSSTLNMRGHTVVLNASSVVIPNNPYRIRLAIADYGDSDFDSAVFIAAGSFTTTFDIGDDRLICDGDTYLLDTGLDNTYTFQWLQGGVPLPGEVNPTYTVSQSGVYTVVIDKGSCHIEDSITFNPLAVNAPINISTCDNGSANQDFDLTINNLTQLGLDPTLYELVYYETPADIIADNPITNTTNFTSGGQTIYIKIRNLTTSNFCDAEYTFDLVINSTVVAGTGITGSICENSSSAYDLSQHDTAVINGQTGTYIIRYFTNEADANSGTSEIGSMVTISGSPGVVTYWIRIQDSNNSNCYDVTSVDITINPEPLVDTVTNVVECSSFVLPAITNGNYYNGPNGTGTMYNAGDIIDTGGTYYIFNGPDANGCTNESSFNITLIDEYEPQLDNCGVFTIPPPPEGIGAFYTAAGGSSGSGVLIPQGTEFSNATQATIIQTVFYYAEVNGLVCQDNQYDINIHPLPLIDDPDDVVFCDTYTLPALTTGGNYYSGSNGTGVMLNAGEVISVNGPNFPGTYYVFGLLNHTMSDGVTIDACILQNPFQVDLVDTTLFTPVSGCGSYILPAIAFGNYFDQPNGMGTIVDANIPITSSQIVYYYTNTTTLPNCTDNLNYNITINSLPAVDVITTTVACGEYALPVLTNGTYYTLSGGPMTPGQVQLNAFDVIDLTGDNLAPNTTYYIFSGPDANSCTNESSFNIQINPYPPTDPVIDRIECNAYSIATPVNGTIYTASGGPNGSGTVVDPATQFNTDNTFYIYNIDPTTGCEADFPFTVFFNGINLPDYLDVAVCEAENYALPTLTHVPPSPTSNYTIDYYLDTNGNGIPGDSGDTQVPAGTVFNIPNTTITIYVVAINRGRFGIVCTEIDSFDVIVSETPVLPSYTAFDNQDYCGSFTLPALPVAGYTVNYYSQPGGNPANIINPANYTFTLSGTTPQTFDVWVYAQATNNANCNDEDHFQFTLYPRPTFSVLGGYICINPTTNVLVNSIILDSGLDETVYTIEWTLNGTLMGTGATYEALEAGTYDVTAELISGESAPTCNYEPTQVTVLQSSNAVAEVILSEPFENPATATVNILQGYGMYEYLLDDGNYQTSNVFNNVSSGDHFIIINDILGDCDDTILYFTVIKYPNFFTPNGDGYNDTWNIFDLDDQPDAVISIFDRYGKLLKQISPTGIGWDGTYNGEKMPSSDYWFVVSYNYKGQQREFKAHFSMKR